MARTLQISFATVLVVILLTPQASEAGITVWLSREPTSFTPIRKVVPFLEKGIKQLAKKKIATHLPSILNKKVVSATQAFDPSPLNYIDGSFAKTTKPYIPYFDYFTSNRNINSKLQLKDKTINTFYTLFNSSCNRGFQCIYSHDSIDNTEYFLFKEWNF